MSWQTGTQIITTISTFTNLCLPRVWSDIFNTYYSPRPRLIPTGGYCFHAVVLWVRLSVRGSDVPSMINLLQVQTEMFHDWPLYWLTTFCRLKGQRSTVKVKDATTFSAVTPPQMVWFTSRTDEKVQIPMAVCLYVPRIAEFLDNVCNNRRIRALKIENVSRDEFKMKVELFS